MWFACKHIQIQACVCVYMHATAYIVARTKPIVYVFELCLATIQQNADECDTTRHIKNRTTLINYYGTWLSLPRLRVCNIGSVVYGRNGTNWHFGNTKFSELSTNF